MDPILLSTVLTSLIPAGVDAVKSWVSKKTDGKPAVLTADDYAKVIDADIRKLAAIAQLDKGDGPSYPWVNATRQIQRPGVVAGVLVSWLYGVFTDMPEANFQTVSQMASSVFFYLFGDRVNLYVKRSR